MSDNIQDFPVLRAAHLDTSDLDKNLLVNLKQLLNQDLFRYAQFGLLQKYHVEVYSIVKFVIWYNTYYKSSQTISQSIFDWSYRNQTKTKLVLHGIIYCLDEWLEENIAKIFTLCYHFAQKLIRLVFGNGRSENSEDRDRLREVRKLFEHFSLVYKLARFLNFLVFLYEGKFCHLWERVLNLRPFYNRAQTMRNFNHDLTMREELWQTYFSLFKIFNNAFDFQNVIKKFKRKFMNNNDSEDNESKRNANMNNYSICAICENEPTMAHCSIEYENLKSCKHVYCYLCIREALIDNENKHVCTLCSNTVTDIELYVNNQNLN